MEVPARLLSCPPPQRRVRELNLSHVNELKASFNRQGGNLTLPTLAVHVANAFPNHILEDDVLEGKHDLEVIGGNHTREALMDLDVDIKVPVTIYAGLSNDQALLVGYEHNKVHQSSREMTFAEDVILFRSRLVGDPEAGLTQANRTQWRKRMANILGVTVSL